MWIIATLIFFGILFILIETLLVPGIGVAGVLGLGSLIASCWYAFAYISTTAGIIVTAAELVVVVALILYVLRSKTWKKLELDTEIASKVNLDSSRVKVGDSGETLTRLAPMGNARIGSLTCEVKSSDGRMIAPHTAVEVDRIEDGKIMVKPINE